MSRASPEHAEHASYCQDVLRRLGVCANAMHAKPRSIKHGGGMGPMREMVHVEGNDGLVHSEAMRTPIPLTVMPKLTDAVSVDRGTHRRLPSSFRR